MMTVAGCASTIAYYGFANWLPSLIEAQGETATRSLVYTALIALAYPLAPIGVFFFADRIERKWQIVAGTGLSACAGLAFARQDAAVGWIACGLLVTVGNNLMACASHTYRSELFPTAVRGRAIGLIYSCDRLVAAVSSYAIGWLFVRSGAGGAVLAVTGAALLDMLVIGLFGPRTMTWRSRSSAPISEIDPGADGYRLGPPLLPSESPTSR